VKVVA
jgi:hypothetical protein